jgi:hypothetical protein
MVILSTFVDASYWSRREQGDTSESEGGLKNQPDTVVVKRIPLLEYSWAGTTPSAEAKQLCCISLGKLILGVIAHANRWSLGIYVLVARLILPSLKAVWGVTPYCVSSADLLSRILLNRVLQYYIHCGKRYTLIDTIFWSQRTEKLPCFLGW